MGMRRVLVVVAVVAALAGAGGCGVSREQADAQERAELLARPSVESMLGRLDAMLAEIRQRWQDELGIDGWTTDGDRIGSGCGNNMRDVGERYTGMWSREGPIPDEKWLRAREIVGEVGARYGFEPPFAVVSRPGIHDAYVHGPYGAEVSFGSGVNVTLGAWTGCHPLAAAKSGAGG